MVASGTLPRVILDDLRERLADRTRHRGIRLIVDRSEEAMGAAEAGVYSLKQACAGGAASAHVISEDGVSRVRAPTVNIRSKIGAGDSMVAGLVLGLAQGRSLHNAVQYGVAAGSAAVMTPGTELCHREDVETLYRWMKSAG